MMRLINIIDSVLKNLNEYFSKIKNDLKIVDLTLKKKNKNNGNNIKFILTLVRILKDIKEVFILIIKKIIFI